MVGLVRPVNLIIVGITLMLFWFFLIHPVFFQNEITPLLDLTLFTLLLIMTVLVTAAGYIFNDIVDVRTDSINKPSETYIGQIISVKRARTIYFAFNITALLLAGFIVYQTQSFNTLALCAICILILYLYSRYLKTSILMGNVVVSLLIALIPFIFIIVETEAFNELYIKNPNTYLSTYSTIFSFTIFAFLANLVREVVKDCEDKEGDQKSGVLTLATALGYKKADLVSQSISIVLFLAALVWLFLKNIPSNIIELSIYTFIVLFPIGYLYWSLTKRERNKSKYTAISSHIKMMMVLGLVYLVVHLNMNYA